MAEQTDELRRYHITNDSDEGLDNDMLAQEFADAVRHAMGRDYEQDDLREMFDEGMTVEDAIADLFSAEADRRYMVAVDNVMRAADIKAEMYR